MLAAAAAQPDRLVVGVDANAAGMMTASRRAAARPSRGGLPNALFAVATVEALPAELDEVADLVTVHFPWGSLLRGLLGADPATMTGLTRVLRPGATLQLLVSSTDRDRGAGVPPIQPAALHTPGRVACHLGTGRHAAAAGDCRRRRRCPLELGKRLGAGTGRSIVAAALLNAHQPPGCGPPRPGPAQPTP